MVFLPPQIRIGSCLDSDPKTLIGSSVPDPSHLETDMDPWICIVYLYCITDLDPALFVSGFQDTKKIKCFT